MTKQEKNLLKNKREYLKLAYYITKYRLAGQDVPAELLERVRTARISGNFTREELDNIVKC